MSPLHCHLDFAVQILSQMMVKQPTPVAAAVWFFFHCSEQTSLRRSNIPSLGIFPALSALGKIIACLLFLHLACSQNQSVYSETILYAIWCSKHRLSSPLSSLNSPLQTVLWKTESHWNTSEIFSRALAFGSCFIQSQYQNEEGTCAKNTDALRWLGRERSHQFAPCSWIRCAVIKRQHAWCGAGSRLFLEGITFPPEMG